MDKKREILFMYLKDGLSEREIARRSGLSRTTVRKYLYSYDKKNKALLECDDKNIRKKIIDDIVNAPKYDSSSRTKIKLTEEVKEQLHMMLAENEEKILTGRRKNIKKIVDMHADLVNMGHDISYTTVCNYLRDFKRSKEAFIRQEYAPGKTIEFDWGDVKLVISGKVKTFHMGLLTTARGSYHHADLYRNMKTENFLDVHVNGIKTFGGSYREFVYDNLKQAVKRFVGLNEKEPTEDLLKISLYYGFAFRFCNTHSPNEKPHVERGVELVRRKIFSKKDDFETFEEARKYFREGLEILNAKKSPTLNNKSPKDVLEEEREHLIPLKPPYDISRNRECRVSKYSAINIDSNYYSVPDYLVGRFVKARIYIDKIFVYYKNEIVCHHKRSYKNHDWVIDIMHYINTLKKKPGALSSSVAIRQIEPRLQYIYKTYYTSKARAFIELLDIIRKRGLDDVCVAIEELSGIKQSMVTTENIRNIVNKTMTKTSDTAIETTIDEASRELITKINSLFSVQRR